jgi:hypothetical protein
MEKTLDDYFRDWMGEAFGFGYGTGEDYFLPALRAFFLSLKDGRSYWYTDLETQFGGLAAWLLINLLCNQDVLEYGTSPRGAWLTAKGERLRDYMLAKTPDEIDAVLNYDESYANCYRNACNCGEGGYVEGRVCANPFWHEKAAFSLSPT